MFYVPVWFCGRAPPRSYRAVVVFVASLLSPFLLFLFNATDNCHIFAKFRYSCYCIFAMVVLFLGPIVQRCFDRRCVSKADFLGLFLAPPAEELIYRSFTCSLWEAAGISKGYIIFASPLLFGLSHFHHYFLGGLANSLMNSISQCGYTTLFGCFAAFVWCRTHSWITCTIAHLFCNFMGLPYFGAIRRITDVRVRTTVIGAYVLGLCGFVLLLVWLVNCEA
jgi:prenyl protein peptidase